MNIEIVITCAVVILALYWSFSDPRPWKDRIRFTDIKRKYVGLLAIIIYALLFYTGKKYPVKYGDLEVPILFFAFLIFMVGFNLALWAKQTMGESWNLPGKFHKKKQKNLVVDGPFRYTRNPIYLGLLLIGFASAVIFKSPAAPIMILCYFFLRYKIIPSEEKSLEHAFGEKYRRYCQSVPRFI